MPYIPPRPQAPLPRREPLFPPEPPKRGSRRLAMYIAFGLAALFLPLTIHYQNERARTLREKYAAAHPTPSVPPKTIEETGDQNLRAEERQWHMDGVDGTTETQARSRFGKPIFSRDYNVSYGTFFGPEFGLKHFYLNDSPGFEERRKAAAVAWSYPQYTTIREMIFKMRESYLTVWLHEPRMEVSLKDNDASAMFPRSAPGEWVVIDNYRVGQDLVGAPPVSNTKPEAPKATP